MRFDWAGFETDLTAAAVTAVRALAGAAAGQQPYAVAFSEFYAETTGVIYLPNLALATEQTVPEPSCRFSPLARMKAAAAARLNSCSRASCPI